MTEAAQAIDETKKPETFLHTVEVDIADEEMTARTQRLLDVLNKIDTTEADKASRVSDLNSELKQLRKEAQKIRATINTKRERRDVEVYEQPDFRRNIVFIVRASDGKVIDERAMTLEDRESELPFDKKKGAENDAGDGASGSGGGEATEDAEIQKQSDAAAAKNKGAGKVTRIKASDVKKRKEARAAADKARELADQKDADNAAAEAEESEPA